MAFLKASKVVRSGPQQKDTHSPHFHDFSIFCEIHDFRDFEGHPLLGVSEHLIFQLFANWHIFSFFLFSIFFTFLIFVNFPKVVFFAESQ